MLFIFVELAAVHHRGRRGARSDSGKIRQRKTVGHALRGRAVFGTVGQDRDSDVMRNLRRAARSLPDLHARRRRMRHGAEETWVTRARLTLTCRPGQAEREPGPIPRDLSIRYLADAFYTTTTPVVMGPRVRGDDIGKSRRCGRQTFVEFVVDRRERAERLGRERDRLAVAVRRRGCQARRRFAR